MVSTWTNEALSCWKDLASAKLNLTAASSPQNTSDQLECVSPLRSGLALKSLSLSPPIGSPDGSLQDKLIKRLALAQQKLELAQRVKGGCSLMSPMRLPVKSSSTRSTSVPSQQPVISQIGTTAVVVSRSQSPAASKGLSTEHRSVSQYSSLNSCTSRRYVLVSPNDDCKVHTSPSHSSPVISTRSDGDIETVSARTASWLLLDSGGWVCITDWTEIFDIQSSQTDDGSLKYQLQLLQSDICAKDKIISRLTQTKELT